MTEEETYDKMIETDIPDMPERLIKLSFEALEHNYDISQRAKMELVHNEIVKIINETSPRPEHVLLVLEVLRSEIVGSCSAMFFTPPPPTERAVTLDLNKVDPSENGMEEDTVE